VRNNYSCPEKPSDYWWLYTRVVSANKNGNLKTLRFEVDKDGAVHINGDDFMSPRAFESYEPITPAEFDRQYALMLKHAAKLNAAPGKV
jgi:hypothetical protein